MPQPPAFRLPRTVVPERYDLTLEPDLAAASFTGTMTVAIDVREPVAVVVLNAAELAIDEVHVVDEHGARREARIELDGAAEQAILRLEEEIAPGPWTLHAEFRGILNDELRGFYRSTFTDAAGAKHVIATTQFQAADARRAFPCWDEPDFKAVFAVNLVVPEGMLAVSNGPEEERTPERPGIVRVRFAPTMRMSTYLVAFVVGPLEATDPVMVHGVPLRVVHLPGKGRLARFALTVGTFALEHLARYYGIPYPAEKLDLIGIPDFAWGAMENLGAITFRESALLVDPDRAGQTELARVIDVIAHEIAHMWFGDLVTMKWWNGTWLNEAFATFMEMKVADAYRPAWKRWLAFATEPGVGRETSMDIDALVASRAVEYPVTSPEEADEMFDALTYGKGAAIVRMLEQYLGEGTFRRGITDYLQWHLHGNTDTADLWEALTAASGEAVGPLMEEWVFRPGYPCIDVVPGPHDTGFTLTQRRFLYGDGAGDRSWQIPVLYRTPVGGLDRLVLAGPETVATGADWIVVNAGGHGFYRVRYAAALRDRLVTARELLAPLERYGLVSDLWAFVLAGDEPAAAFLDFVRGFGDEAEPVIWETIVAGLDGIDRYAPGAGDVPALVGDLVGPAAAELGWSPHRRDDDLAGWRRRILLAALGTLGRDPATRETARQVFARAGRKSGSVSPDVERAALTIVADSGTAAEYEECIARYRGAPTPQEELAYLRALPRFPEPRLVEATLDHVLLGTIRSQDGPAIVGAALANRVVGDHAWRFVTERWGDFCAVLPPITQRRILDGIAALAAFGLEREVEEFFTDHPVRGGERYQAQQLERLRVRAALRDREASREASG